MFRAVHSPIPARDPDLAGAGLHKNDPNAT